MDMKEKDLPKNFNACPTCGKVSSGRRKLISHMLECHQDLFKTKSEAIAEILGLKDRLKDGKFYCLNCGKEINENWLFSYFADNYKDSIPNTCGNAECKIKIRLFHSIGKHSHKFTEESHRKRQKTCLERYGVDHPMKVDGNKDRMKNTCIDRYGDTSSMRNSEVKAKRVKNNLERYGKEYPIQVPSIKFKQINTNLEKYGVEYAFEKSVHGNNSRIYIGLVDNGSERIFKVGVGDVWQRWCCILQLLPELKLISLKESVDRQKDIRVNFEHPLHEYLKEFSYNGIRDIQGDFLQCSRKFHSSTGYTEWFKGAGYEKALEWLNNRLEIRDVTEGFIKFSEGNPFPIIKDTISTISLETSNDLSMGSKERSD